MLERQSSDEQIINRAGEILEYLGLTWEDIKATKDVLDVGARDACIARAARLLGISTRIVSVDIQATEPMDSSFVVASANHLPFADNSFDLVISHAAPPSILIHSREELRDTLVEFRRVLRDNGECRFGAGGDASLPLYIAYDDFDPTTFDFANENNNETARKSLEVLQAIDPTITSIRKHVGDVVKGSYNVFTKNS